MCAAVSSCAEQVYFALCAVYCAEQVYWGNGCQIIPPHDHGIAASIEANLEPWSLPDGPIYSVAGMHAISACMLHRVRAPSLSLAWGHVEPGAVRSGSG